MSDTRMPNFWWCPTHHLYRGGAERPCADAVKLGDIEALRAEIRAVLDRRPEKWGPCCWVFRDLRAIVEGEPAREEPQPGSDPHLSTVRRYALAIRAMVEHEVTPDA